MSHADVRMHLYAVFGALFFHAFYHAPWYLSVRVSLIARLLIRHACIYMHVCIYMGVCMYMCVYAYVCVDKMCQSCMCFLGKIDVCVCMCMCVTYHFYVCAHLGTRVRMRVRDAVSQG